PDFLRVQIGPADGGGHLFVFAGPERRLDVRVQRYTFTAAKHLPQHHPARGRHAEGKAGPLTVGTAPRYDRGTARPIAERRATRVGFPRRLAEKRPVKPFSVGWKALDRHIGQAVLAKSSGDVLRNLVASPRGREASEPIDDVAEIDERELTRGLVANGIELL